MPKSAIIMSLCVLGIAAHGLLVSLYRVSCVGKAYGWDKEKEQGKKKKSTHEPPLFAAL
jgi:hypothetical protein